MTSERPVEEVSKGASLKKVTVSSDSEGGSREWRPLSAAVDVTMTRENEEDCH
jgi:hypothetical protein